MTTTTRRATQGARLRGLREELGLDVTMAARIAGLTPETLLYAEAGGRERTWDTELALAALYGHERFLAVVYGSGAP